MKTDSDGAESPYELNITWFSALNHEDSGEPQQLQIDRFIASRAVALVLRGVPGIYLPSILGSRNDVDAVFRDDSRRSINRSGIDESRLFEILRDEDAVPTRVARAYVDLLRARVAEPAFHPNAAQRVLELDPRVLAVVRTSIAGESRVLCLINVSGDEVEISVSAAEAGLQTGRLADLAGGDSVDASSGRIELILRPYGVCWLQGSVA
jgi:sucrose phosphorylase